MLRFKIASVVAVLGAAAVTMGASAAATPRVTAVPTVHLSAAEQKTMQATIDRQLASSIGGKQVGINQISYEGGKLIMTFPLPGEVQARAVNEPVTPLGTANCDSLHACLWTDTNFNGTRLGTYHGIGYNCGTFDLANYNFASTASSVHNNQSSGTQTVLLNSSRQIENANLAPSRINDLGVSAGNKARYWTVC